MIEKTHTIPLNTAEALWELRDCDEPYGGYAAVADEQIATRRWVSAHRVIIRRESDQTLWALDYEMGLTENQECDLFPGGDPVTVHAVRAEEYTATRYVTA